MEIVERYLLQLNTDQQRFRRAVAVLMVLSFVVVLGVSWSLRLTGVAMANDACCGQVEHRHTEECPTEKVLVCGMNAEPSGTDTTAVPTETASAPTEGETVPEETASAPTEVETVPEEMEPMPTEAETVPEETASAPTEGETVPEETEPMSTEAETVPEETEPIPSEAETIPAETTHQHTDACYEIVWLCGMEEHIHELSCYSDPSADVESAADWEATLPELTDYWDQNLVQIAISQLGNRESERNFVVAEDGETRNGITRYGQWYGNPYGDWSAMFVMFCLNYANIPQDVIPWSPGVDNMYRLAQEAQILSVPEDEQAAEGDILFLDTDQNEKADAMGIVTGVDEETMTVICGDWENVVQEISLELQPADETAPVLQGYIHTYGQQVMYQEIPVISLVVEAIEETQILRITAELTNIDETLYLWQWQVSEDGGEPWTDLEGAEGLVYEMADTEENSARYYRIQGRMAEPPMTFAITDDETSADAESGTITSEAISPFSIGKNNNVYTIDVYALPVNQEGEQIAAVTKLGSIHVNSTTKIAVANQFDDSLGTYQSAYFGTETSVSVDNIASVWRYRSGWTYYLAYQQVNGTTNNRWKSSADSATSLYLRYIPTFTVSFASEGFETLTEEVVYNNTPTMTEPGTWTREGYKLAGWTIDSDEQNLYTWEEILRRAITADVTYTAQWNASVTVSFDPGEYADALYPIEPVTVPYSGVLPQIPTPVWKNNSVAMAFDGWYLDEERTQPVTADTVFYADATVYAKWQPKEDGYYVYFMDFAREDQSPLVLATYSVTEGKTASPYTPGNAPEGMDWDGVWYLDPECTIAYDFSIPVSDMTDYLTGANNQDLHLYPGTQPVCKAIFVTYGTKIDPVTVSVGETIDLDDYAPERSGYTFAGWTLKDGTAVSGVQTLSETTTYYAKWDPGYVPFEAILRIENPNDTGMTQADILGTWYALSGSQIRVNSTYTGTGDNRTGTHKVVCVLDGVEYPVYTDAARTKQATLSDVYATYFIYNNTGTTWTDEVNWDDVYTGGETPYSTRPISSAGDTIINFDYMRVRNDIVFTIPNNSSTGGYIDVYKLQQSGLITGSVIYDGTKPTSTGQNVSAHGVSAENISWSYTAAASVGNNDNDYTLHGMKYGQRIYEVYPVGASWLTPRTAAYHQYNVEGGQLFASRRQDLTADFFKGSGRGLAARTLTAEFVDQEFIALMYAVECLAGETPDFTINGVGYKVDTELCEVVKHTGGFAIKDLDGCNPGVCVLGTYNNSNKYYTANTIPNNQRNYAVAMSSAQIGSTSVYTLFNETYWPYYAKFNGVQNIQTFAKAYIFYYDRLYMGIQFNFAYDSDGDGSNEIVEYEDIAFGERIGEYQFGSPDYEQHPLLEREGYEFVGWLDANGFVLEAEDWESMVVTGDSENNSMIFIAKWEKISNNIVEYYEDVSSTQPFETHYFDDSELLQYPTMAVYPEGWVWQEYGEGQYEPFDWDVPMYGEYGVQEVRTINGEERVVNVIRIYGTWDESHTKVIYDPNAPQGGVPGSAPTDSNEYTIWQSEVSVKSKGDTANTDPEAVFVGWQLDRNGVVYQPGDHVPVHWPRTMTFTAQWAKPEEVVYLRYDPNGGSPQGYYPNENGFAYKKNATASVWANTDPDGTAWYQRTGYEFTGWNTQPDGSGTAYEPGSTITLTEPLTTLYAQWEKHTHSFELHKIDHVTGKSLAGAEFELYRQEGSDFVLLETHTTGGDGHIAFADIETGTLYRLVESRPPDGYAIMTREISFRLTPQDSFVVLEFCDGHGNAISKPYGVTGEYFSGVQKLTFTIGNLAGVELPSTGGIGLPIYILCGVMLMLAPLVYGLRLRRRYRKEANG